MAVKVTILLDAPDDVLSGYAAGAVMRLESSATETGVYVSVQTIAVVAATFSYEYWDNAGDTTTWYRWRLENAAGTETGEYSVSFQGTDPAVDTRTSESYADVDDLLVTMRQASTDQRWLAAAKRHLIDTTRALISPACVGYSFFRSGTEVRRFHGRGDRCLHVHPGIVSVSLVEILPTIGGAWVELEADDWYLEGYPGQDAVSPGEPYFHVVLESNATYSTFPTTARGVRLTGVFGWPAITSDARAANVAYARQRLAMDPSMPGGPIGPEEFGNPIGPDRWPRVVYDFVMGERRRHAACAM